MGERVLLVEGEDDKHVMCNLFEVRKVAEVFHVERPKKGANQHENGGVDQLLESIPYRVASSELDRLAVVLDANDKGPAIRWQSIRSRLLNAGYEDIPEKHDPKGTVFDLSLRARTPRSVRFSVWVMPDNHSTGMLEDFVAGLIREDDEMLPRVDGFLDSIPTEQRRFSPQHHPKARIHAWLAVGERPGRPMGQAIKADAQLDANHPTVEPFLDWVQVALVD